MGFAKEETELREKIYKKIHNTKTLSELTNEQIDEYLNQLNKPLPIYTIKNYIMELKTSDEKYKN